MTSMVKVMERVEGVTMGKEENLGDEQRMWLSRPPLFARLRPIGSRDVTGPYGDK